MHSAFFITLLAGAATAVAQETVQGINQITDGQIQQQTTVVGITQISDGQVQATAPAPPAQTTVVGISQISDGQVQASYVSSLASLCIDD